jgi:hypothetical protein
VISIKPRKSINLAILGILFAAFSLIGAQSVMASDANQDACPQLIWKEKQTNAFVILYTASHISLADQIEQSYVPLIESELVKIEQAFGQPLPIPITIRIYPSEKEYYCLNAFAPTIGSQDIHSHIGSREIALIANVIFYRQTMWETHAVNAFRHQIGVLYGELISDGEAPPGLLQGMGGYFEDPFDTFESRHQSAGSISVPDRGWQRLLEEDIPASDAGTLLQQTSLVAFLIDVYGWDRYLDFLVRIPQVQGYRQAGLDVYGINIQGLQDAWIRYLPIYIQDRWQANVIHNYDLTQFEKLISGGAYSDAQTQLQAAMPLIELFGDQNKVGAANTLLEKAGTGVQAGDLALAARQAVLDGEFETGLESAEQSLALYAQLGDTRRNTEIEIYRQVCNEVLLLRGEVDKISGDAAPLDPIRTDQLIRIGQRLSELGDSDGIQKVQLALLLLGVSQQKIVTWVTVIGILICALLIGRRLWAAVRRDYRVEELL